MSSVDIEEVNRDIASATDNTGILHATNCLGEWGSGIAFALTKLVPNAFE
jgi:O-acetyl-ADP-ribose deacetylase (regulator of RNase III)